MVQCARTVIKSYRMKDVQDYLLRKSRCEIASERFMFEEDICYFKVDISVWDM